MAIPAEYNPVLEVVGNSTKCKEFLERFRQMEGFEPDDGRQLERIFGGVSEVVNCRERGLRDVIHNFLKNPGNNPLDVPEGTFPDDPTMKSVYDFLDGIKPTAKVTRGHWPFVVGWIGLTITDIKKGKDEELREELLNVFDPLYKLVTKIRKLHFVAGRKLGYKMT